MDIYNMCHNQQRNSPKQKPVQAAASLYSTYREQLTTACILWSLSVYCASGRGLSHQQPYMRLRQSYLSDSKRSWAQGMRCWEVSFSTLISAGVFSESIRAEARAQQAHQAQPGSSRRRLRQLWSACTALYPRWSLQRMVVPPLWITQTRKKMRQWQHRILNWMYFHSIAAQ